MRNGSAKTRRCIALAAIALAVVAVSAFFIDAWGRDQTKTFRPIPDDVMFQPSSASRHFQFKVAVTLRYVEPERRKLVTFEVTVENKSGRPIKELLVTAELPRSLVAYSGGQFLTFGQMDAMDLVPGEMPYGLIACRTQVLPDPDALSDQERARFYAALRQPIKIALWWQDGQEYLTLDPDNFTFVDFPGWE